ncbi:uncharacterized RNA-binding protein C17H9.04c isoform X1 [Dioscorea cayenensis subsp. rotundata]|uniref:Uncharacterized RNA-binding protein C17H9.04c isoform X1 n=1 Tax=Dioscorea cayennensis subsp. rotundata TaxID=55577 RepID=A0AB40CEN9_DIOCR|nr:uncharacterized RNA-binding protein C17H9.04c isoform X1 [Dioscorea cayenensis subsp. rotundata]
MCFLIHLTKNRLLECSFPTINLVLSITSVECMTSLWVRVFLYVFFVWNGWVVCVTNGSIGCSNNNYASREKCKKCGQPKEETAMPAIAMRGASLPTYAHYFARAHGLSGLGMNFGITGSYGLQPSLLPNSGLSYGGIDKYGLQSIPRWPTPGGHSSGLLHVNNISQPLVVPRDWRSGDWICNCGFHNYSSRTQCKKCNAPLPSGAPPSSAVNSAVSNIFPTLGTKRLASEEFVNDWDSKRLNAGDINSHFLNNGQQRPYQGFEQLGESTNDQSPGTMSRYSSGNLATMSSTQLKAQSPQLTTIPLIVGKGAKQWRDGDWMCNNCNNHNYASRTHCNRCKSQKQLLSL